MVGSGAVQMTVVRKKITCTVLTEEGAPRGRRDACKLHSVFYTAKIKKGPTY